MPFAMASWTADSTPARDPLAKHEPDIHSAVTTEAATAEWEFVTGSADDTLHVAFVDHAGQQYTLLRDNADTLLIFDEHEWACFVDGVKNNEF